MAKAPAKSVDELIIDALRTAFESAESELRLVTAGKQTGLFAKKTAEFKKAIDACLDRAAPLLEVVREEKSGKTTTPFVRLADAGLAKLLKVTASPAELLARAPADRKQRLLGMWMESSRQALDRLAKEIRTLQTAYKDHLSSMHQKAADLARELDQLQSQAASNELPPTRAIPVPRPTDTLNDLRNLAQQWESANGGTQQSLHDRLKQAGATLFGVPSETTGFESRLHRSNEDIFPGDPIRITRSGWIFRQMGVDHVLAKAAVEPSAT